ncbi:hypothetical protein ACFQ1S_03180 [Kibdelosporangium lantanae]|uniref:Uncharacterized protein n=1 Tax=Kibdelosporangium lantanae TaxID=1497396 RepID=A0ABW3M5L0_9PSEU
MRVISIGRNRTLLDRLTAALEARGHEAVSTSDEDDPLIDNPYDVVGFGRAVTPETRARLETLLRAHNPDIAAYRGMCPEVGVLVAQAEYELARRDDSVVAGFELVDDEVRFEVHQPVALTWKIRHVNVLFRGSDRVLQERTYEVGEHVVPVEPRAGRNFLQVDAQGTVFVAQL